VAQRWRSGKNSCEFPKTSIKYYFQYNDDLNLKFGAAHSDFRIDFSDLSVDLRNYFEIWDEYKSAQLVLFKND